MEEIKMFLDTVLLDQFNKARATPGKAVEVQLGNGLYVRMIIEARIKLCLSLRRSTVTPSLTEWKTIIKHLPWHPHPIAPIILSDNSIYARMIIHPKYL
jgi:hypothetical protein